MKKMFNRIVSTFIAAIMIACAAPLTGFVGLELPSLVGIKASATSVYKKDGFSYIIEDNFVKIIDFDTTISGVIVVPSTISGYVVDEISNSAFYDCAKITRVTLPSTIKKIGSYAFYNCELLTQINLPNSIIEIGSSAFAHCDVIDNIILPQYLTTIESYVFQSCSSLKNIVVPENVTQIKSNAFYYCSNLSEITLHDELLHIGSYAFGGTKYYSSKSNWNDGELYIGNHLVAVDKTINGAYSIKENTKVISERCFYGQNGMTSLSIPSSVTVIDDYAFSSCASLTNVTVANGVECIGSYAFAYCYALGYINIPSSVKKIGSYAFSSSNIRNIGFVNGLEEIQSGAFYLCSNLKNITIPESLKRLGSSAFYGCTSLETVDYNAINCQPTDASTTLFGSGNSVKNINIGENVQTIPPWIFSYCDLITSITIPRTVSQIGDNAFGYCHNLKEIYYNAENCVEIGTKSINAFFDCSGVEKVYIGNSVEYIPAFAFTGCDNLKYVDIPETLTNIDDCAFAECYKLCIECSPNTYLHNYVVKNNIEYILTDSTAKTSFKIKNGVLCGYYGESKDFVLPADVRTIGMKAFDSNNLIKCVELPYSTTMILNNAFSNCSNLEKVVIPYTVTNIAENAFDNTDALIVCQGNSYADNFATKKGISTETLSLVLNTNALSMSVNEEYNLVASTSPQTKLAVPVSFLSSNEAVASVDSNGKVTASTLGCSTITASSIDGSMEAYCQIIVVSNGSDEPITPSTYTVTYNANGGKNVPASQTKESDVNIVLSSVLPSKSYTLSFNANGGNVAPTSSKINAVFREWNSKPDGNGVSYAPGSVYKENSTITLYAIWDYPEVDTLPIPERSGYTFIGWFTASGANPVEKGDLLMADVTLYAHWTVNDPDEPDDPVITTYTITWIIDETSTIQTYKEGDTINKPATPSKSGYTFKGWTPEVPSTMPTHNLTFTAVFEKNSESIVPSEPVKADIINQPTQTTISYGDSIVLHVDASKIPAGGYVEWYPSNGNFSYTVSADGTTCTITPDKKGDTTFTTSIYDEQGNAVLIDEHTMTSKAGFFDKIIAFFKKLFGLTKTIPQIYYGTI